MAVVDHLVIPFDPNDRHGDALHEVPNLITFDEFFHIFSPHSACFQRKMSLNAFAVIFLSFSIGEVIADKFKVWSPTNVGLKHFHAGSKKEVGRYL